jgi:hypothetical protein
MTTEPVRELPWYLCDRGLRRLGWILGAVLAAYWGWFLLNLAESMREGMVVPKVLVGLMPAAVLALLAAKKPRSAGVVTMLLGVGAGVAVALAGHGTGMDVAAMLAFLSIAAGGVMAFSAHR